MTRSEHVCAKQLGHAFSIGVSICLQVYWEELQTEDEEDGASSKLLNSE